MLKRNVVFVQISLHIITLRLTLILSLFLILLEVGCSKAPEQERPAAPTAAGVTEQVPASLPVKHQTGIANGVTKDFSVSTLPSPVTPQASSSPTTDLKRNPSAVPDISRRHAIIVSVGKYPPTSGLPNLRYADNDATQLAQVLLDSGYQTTLMTQNVGVQTGQHNYIPNAKQINDRLKELLGSNDIDSKDMIIIAFAGHGVQFQSRGGESANPKFYFCPGDADLTELQYAEDIRDKNHLLEIDEIYGLLEKSRAGVKLLFVDACRNDPTAPGLSRAVSSITLPRLPPPPGGIAAFFSCSANQRAIEDPDLQHGVFFHYVIQGLKGDADAGNLVRPPDRRVTLTELTEHVGQCTTDFVMRKYGGTKQTPEFRGELRGPISLVELGTTETSVTTARLAPPDNKMPTTSNTWEGHHAGESRIFNQAMKLRMIWCPSGHFKMRTPAAKPEEATVEVQIPQGFWIGQTELTWAQWRFVTGWVGSYENGVSAGDPHYLPADYDYPYDDFPVNKICHGARFRESGKPDAIHRSATWFCETLTQQEQAAGRMPTGWKYSLPTEAQWEYACRAGTTNNYSEDKLTNAAWYKENSDLASPILVGNPPQPKIVFAAFPVALKAPNAWGIYDMHGNVAEYCQDWFSTSRNGDTSATTPTSEKYRVLRGGSHRDPAKQCQTDSRAKVRPEYSDSRYGFRLVLIQRDDSDN